MTEWILLVLGLIVGGVAAWFLASSRASGTVAELRAQLSQLQTTLLAKDQQIADLNSQVRTQSEQKVAAQTELNQVRVALEEERKLLDAAEQKLKDTFKALADDVLKSNSRTFLAIAKGELETVRAQATGDLESRKQAIDGLVQPLQKSLDRYEEQMKQIEQARREDYGSLGRHLTDLQGIARSLDVALRGAQAQPRGKWGEMALQRVAELAGMSEHCDFTQQESIETEEGRLRPDMIVVLCGGRRVPVDAKVPLQAFLDATTATTEEARKHSLREHSRLVRAHLQKLATSGYREQFDPAPVVMFLPGESFLAEALKQDPGLLEEGMAKQVILATPTTLIALLLAVAYGWRQEAIAQNAQRISDQGKELYDRLRKFLEYLEGVRRGLNNAVESYNTAVGSLENRVLVSARRLKDLGAATGEELETVEAIEQIPRRLQASEFTEDE